MKYTIETIGDRCTETIETSNGDKFKKVSERMDGGCRSLTDELADQMENAGYEEEVLDVIDETFGGFMALEMFKLGEWNM